MDYRSVFCGGCGKKVMAGRVASPVDVAMLCATCSCKDKVEQWNREFDERQAQRATRKTTAKLDT